MIKRKTLKIISLCLSAGLVFSSCVSNLKEKASNQPLEERANEVKIVATSAAISEIAEKLNLPLEAVPETVVSKIPERYESLERIGSPMNPDLEKISELNPDYILSPLSLMDDLKPKYEAAKLNYAFLNLNSLEGMYKSIGELGKLFNRNEEAQKLIQDFNDFIELLNERSSSFKKKKVLVLMGLPGSYVVATEKSYVGNLVKHTGGINVYKDEDKSFINANTEDIKKKEADVILLCSHALPDQVMEMFDKEFKENDIWKHMEAVKNDEVYNLSYQNFGMSAKFNYKDAISDLEKILYPKNEAEKKEAKAKSKNAKKESMNSSGVEKYKQMRKKNVR